jgi:hypothetical protein
MKEVDDAWIDAVKPGDLIGVNVKLSLTKSGEKLIVEKGETLLVLTLITERDRISFDVLFRGEHYLSGMERRAFARAFSPAAKLNEAIA